jgi:type II secretory pathway predicted ATPase ExeA
MTTIGTEFTMYKEYFGLKELPFSIAPDPRYFYMSSQHREALAHLVYGINSNGGFILLTGEVGTGKSTVCRCLLEQIPPNFAIALILNPQLTVIELLATMCDELCIEYPKGNTSIKVFIDCINAYLLDAHSKGRKTVIIIEEAQNLSTEVLEQVRLLTNFETTKQKLLQIVMLGQPELSDMLSRPEMRQLSQRITTRYHLSSLSKKEVASYVKHRLSIAGARSGLFPPSSIRKLFCLSRGIPRLINLICDRALLGAYAGGRDRVDRSILSKAAREIFGHRGIQTRFSRIFAGTKNSSAGCRTISTRSRVPYGKKSFLNGLLKRTTKAPLSTVNTKVGLKLMERDMTFKTFLQSLHEETPAENISAPGILVDETTEARYVAKVKKRDEVINADNLTYMRYERRRHKRLLVKEIKRNAPHSSNHKIINISAGGVAVETIKMLRINKEYNLKINYKGNLLRLRGFVVWAMRIREEKKESGDIVPVYKAGMTFLEPLS